MRKKCLGMAVVLFSLQLTGCGAINLTTQEKNVIAEYIANILLKHDKTYEPTLQYEFEDEEQTEPEEKPVQKETEQEETNTEPEQEVSKETTEKEESYLKVSSVYPDGCKVFSRGYSFYQEYPKRTTAILPVEASSGNTICVVKLKVRNDTSAKKKIDFLSANYTYQLKVNSKKTYQAIQSFLVNDIQYLDVSLESGKSSEAVVMFEIPKKMKNKSLQLLITKGSKTAGMTL